MSETATTTPARRKVGKFLSPARVMVRSLRMSRDNWKEKYQELQVKLKRYQVQAHDACKSRDGWRERAEAAELQVAKQMSQAPSLTEMSKKK